MTCLKCAGLMVEEPAYDFFERCTLYRCLQCGLRIDWRTYLNRLASREQGADVPKFASEAHKEEWLAKCRATREANKRKQANEEIELDEDGERFAVAVIDDAAGVMSPAMTSAGPSILAAIDQALERARVILSR